MAASNAGVIWRAARPSDLAYRHTRNPSNIYMVYIYMLGMFPGRYFEKTVSADDYDELRIWEIDQTRAQYAIALMTLGEN